MSDVRCRAPRCRRILRDVTSQSRGYGPVCWRRINPPASRKHAAIAHLPVGAAFEVDPDQLELFVVVPVAVTR